MSQSASTDLAAAVLEARDAVVARLLATEDGREIARLDEAFRVLSGGQEPPPWNVSRTVVGEALAATINQTGRAMRRPRSDSVRARLQTILDEEPVSWDYDTMFYVMRERGWVNNDDEKAFRSSMRSAVHTLVQNGTAQRSENGGRFWSTHHDEIVGEKFEPWALASEDAGGDQQG